MLRGRGATSPDKRVKTVVDNGSNTSSPIARRTTTAADSQAALDNLHTVMRKQ